MSNIKELEDQIFDKMQKIQASLKKKSAYISHPKDEKGNLLKKIEVLEIQKTNLYNELSDIKKTHNNDLVDLNKVIEEIKLLLESSDG
tara:strand:- start:2284 stop:2547 length:264 start_codon:yes stop_codon:yes gene_type:complete